MGYPYVYVSIGWYRMGLLFVGSHNFFSTLQKYWCVSNPKCQPKLSGGLFEQESMVNLVMPHTYPLVMVDLKPRLVGYLILNILVFVQIIKWRIGYCIGLDISNTISHICGHPPKWPQPWLIEWLVNLSFDVNDSRHDCQNDSKTWLAKGLSD